MLQWPGFRLFPGVEVGDVIDHADLARRYHAVIYATGASDSRRLGIPGEDLPGSYTAAELVGWYNGHPEHALPELDLSTERAVIIGNGNVALDVARILLSDPVRLRGTDISERALTALEHSKIREVVVIGRRGLADAAGTAAELTALATTPGISIRSERQERVGADASDALLQRKIALLTGDHGDLTTNRRVRFVFHRAPPRSSATPQSPESDCARTGLRTMSRVIPPRPTCPAVW